MSFQADLSVAGQCLEIGVFAVMWERLCEVLGTDLEATGIQDIEHEEQDGMVGEERVPIWSLISVPGLMTSLDLITAVFIKVFLVIFVL